MAEIKQIWCDQSVWCEETSYEKSIDKSTKN